MEGLVIQARVIHLLRTVVKDLEPDVRRLYPSLRSVSEEGSKVWRLEGLLDIYVSLMEVLESHASDGEDPARFSDACNAASALLERLKAMKGSCGGRAGSAIDGVLQVVPDAGSPAGGAPSPQGNARQRFFRDLTRTKEALLHLIMSMCYE